MPSATHRHVAGGEALANAFRNLSEDMRVRTLEAGVKELVKPIVRAAKQFARRSRDTGALEASLTSKVVNYPRSGKAVGLVGPDRHYYARGKRVKGALGRLLATEQRRPANYAHLVEYGHLSGTSSARFGGFTKGTSIRKRTATATSFVLPKPFIRPAVSTTQGQQAQAFYRGIERGFSRAVAKEEKAGRHVSSK